MEILTFMFRAQGQGSEALGKTVLFLLEKMSSSTIPAKASETPESGEAKIVPSSQSGKFFMQVYL